MSEILVYFSDIDNLIMPICEGLNSKSTMGHQCKGQALKNRTSVRKHLEQQCQAMCIRVEHLNANSKTGSRSVSDAVEQIREMIGSVG
jgi:hypothetical protein